MIYISGPGHGGPAIVANTYLEGTYSEIYPDVSRDDDGMRRLFRQFSFPGGIPSHVAPETPGSIHEGGELGYSLVARLRRRVRQSGSDRRLRRRRRRSGDRPARRELALEQVPQPGRRRRGAADPAPERLQDRRTRRCWRASRATSSRSCFAATATTPYFVEGDDPAKMHRAMAATLDAASSARSARSRSRRAREDRATRPRWPMIVCARRRAGPVRRSSTASRSKARSARIRCRSTDLADESRAPRDARRVDAELPARGAVRRRAGALWPELASWRRAGTRRMGANPHANGGLLLRGPSHARLPRLRRSTCRRPGGSTREATRVLGESSARRRRGQRRDELPRLRPGRDRVEPARARSVRSDRPRSGSPPSSPTTITSAPDGRVMEVLSEHLCQGWLEGYLLTGRHGFFSCYEAFIHIVDSMFNQHAKWLKVDRATFPGARRSRRSTTCSRSHVWRQDHNGFSHQDPGFIDHVVNKKADVIRVYLPPDANTLLSVADHCLRSRNYVNVIVAGKQPALQWLDMDAAVQHCTAGRRHLGLGEQRPRARARRRDGVRRRRPDARDARRGRSAAAACPGAEDPRRQRRRSDDAAAAERASARTVRRGLRRASSRPTSRSSSRSTAIPG